MPSGKPSSGRDEFGLAQLGQCVMQLGASGVPGRLPNGRDGVPMHGHLARDEEQSAQTVAEMLTPGPICRCRFRVVSHRASKRGQAKAGELPADDGHEQHPSLKLSWLPDAHILPRG